MLWKHVCIKIYIVLFLKNVVIQKEFLPLSGMRKVFLANILAAEDSCSYVNWKNIPIWRHKGVFKSDPQ